MARFAVGGRSAATAATIDHVAVQLWNPHATISLYVREVHCFKTAAVIDNHQLIRTTTIGTPGTTITPDVDNHLDRRFAPISGALLHLAVFTGMPAVAGPPLLRTNLPAAIGSGFIYVFSEPVEVPAGTGLAVSTPVAVILQASDFSFIWDE